MVLQTSAKDLETGEISLDTVTAIGTDIAIERTKPTLNHINKAFAWIYSQYNRMF